MAVVKIGEVVSAKMQKTVVVKVTYRVKHPFYKKLLTRTKKFKAHDEKGTKTGQKVKITETKPFAKDVRYEVTEVLNA
ncbi:30S ribosomal protein S17 [Candidatus Curtissbacteria bacterium]|nr:30S ribosomal protein S17 [Candidatus Curtissbacteria bacterium]